MDTYRSPEYAVSLQLASKGASGLRTWAEQTWWLVVGGQWFVVSSHRRKERQPRKDGSSGIYTMSQVSDYIVHT